MQQQKQTLSQLSSSIPSLRKLLSTEISDLNNSCLEAKVEENDYTVLTVDDLEYELELAEVGLKKKIAFIDNQVSLILEISENHAYDTTAGICATHQYNTCQIGRV